MQEQAVSIKPSSVRNSGGSVAAGWRACSKQVPAVFVAMAAVSGNLGFGAARIRSAENHFVVTVQVSGRHADP